MPQLPGAGSCLLPVATAVSRDGHGMSLPHCLLFVCSFQDIVGRVVLRIVVNSYRNSSTCVAVAERFFNNDGFSLFAFEVGSLEGIL